MYTTHMAPILETPVELRWTLPAEFSALIAQNPYRLVVIPRGTKGAAIALQILPPDTIDYVPVDAHCALCLRKRESA